MSFEEAGLHDPFWSIVGDIDPTPERDAQIRIGIAENPVVRLALRWQRQNPHLSEIERTTARDNLVHAVAQHFNTTTDQSYRAISMCEQIIEQEGMQHG